MKKWLKVSLIIIGIIIVCCLLDILSIFIFNRPIFATKDKDGNVYTGLFYDTYNCIEYSVPQIKAKGTKFSCVTNIKISDSVVEIVDTSKNIKDFACDTSLELFYEDAENKYYYSCIKSKYILVKYDSGQEEIAEQALKNGTIKITDLDLYGISYITYKK